MRCLRCGYCCRKLSTVIVVDPELGPVSEENMRAINLFEDMRAINLFEERCPHLKGDKPGEYECLVHDYSWYADSPCGRHQSEMYPDRDCLMGAETLKRLREGREPPW